MLVRQKAAFAPVFYKRFRWHIVCVLLKLILFLGATGSLATVTTKAYFETGRLPYLAALLVAALLYFSLGAVLGIRDLFRVCVLPYFSKRLGDADTFLRGRNLLWHSRELDELAARLGVPLLSEFASGDDMVLGERLRWHDPARALQSVVRIQECQDAASFPPELRSDLRALARALESAREKGVQFCLLLREGSYASGAEMDRRKGSFF